MVSRIATVGLVATLCFLSACSNNDPKETADNPDVMEEDVLNPIEDSSTVDAKIAEFLDDSNVPGLSLALVSTRNNAPIIWNKGYGYANLESQTSVDENTAFWMGSVSKAVLGALLQIAKEQGVVDLDTDIRNDVVSVSGFNIDDPQARSISLRSLATHTSGIRDSDAYSCGYYLNNEDGSVTALADAFNVDVGVPCNVENRVSLRDFLAAYLDSDGLYYNAEENFTADIEPDYSNIGAGLAGHYLEIKSGQSMHEYGASQLFSPVGMDNTGWNTESLAGTVIATPYSTDGDELVTLPNYELATYPEGGLRSTAGDMAKFLSVIMNGGEFEGAQILQPESVTEMITPSELDDEYGFFMELDDGIGHSGSDPGAESFVFYQPEYDAGVVLIINSDTENADEAKLEELIQLLFESAIAM